MSDCISREKLLLALKKWQNTLIEAYGKNDEYVKCLESVLTGIEKAPAADVRPVRTARWTEAIVAPYNLYDHLGMTANIRGYVCSCCQDFSVARYSFCPNCGARMEES